MISRSTKSRSSARNSRWSSLSLKSTVVPLVGGRACARGRSVGRGEDRQGAPVGEVDPGDPDRGRRCATPARRRLRGGSAAAPRVQADPGDHVRHREVRPRGAVHDGEGVDDAGPGRRRARPARRSAAAGAERARRVLHGTAGIAALHHAGGVRGWRPTSRAVVSSAGGTSGALIASITALPPERRWRGWTGSRRCRGPARAAAPGHLPVPGLAAQLAHRLDQQQHPVLAGVAVGQAAAAGVERQSAAGADAAVGDQVQRLARAAEARAPPGSARR